MFSVEQKRAISNAVQKILRDTNHPELPAGEIKFKLHVDDVDVVLIYLLLVLKDLFASCKFSEF